MRRQHSSEANKQTNLGERLTNERLWRRDHGGGVFALAHVRDDEERDGAVDVDARLAVLALQRRRERRQIGLRRAVARQQRRRQQARRRADVDDQTAQVRRLILEQRRQRDARQLVDGDDVHVDDVANSLQIGFAKLLRQLVRHTGIVNYHRVLKRRSSKNKDQQRTQNTKLHRFELFLHSLPVGVGGLC